MNAAIRGTEVVSLDERLRYTRVLRAVLAVAVVLDAVLLPGSLRASFAAVTATATGYLAGSLLLEAGWRTTGHRRGLFSTLLGVDGLFLAAAASLTGGAATPVRYLILVHVAAVTLIASYRTGIKLAGWHSVLQLAGFAATSSGVLSVARGSAPDGHAIVAFTLALWALTLTVGTLAAINDRELRRRRFELEQLAQMGRALEDANDPVSVADVLLDGLVDTFAFRRLALFEVVDGSVPRMLTCRNLRDALVVDYSLGEGSMLATAFTTRETQLIHAIDPATDPWLAALMPTARNVAIVPLVADAVVAVLVAETSEHRARVERRVVSSAERFASHAALAMRNANLLEQMQQMAVTDGLTQLANRRAFDTSLDRELQRAARTDGRLSVVLVDVDHFKLLNDTHGHLVGDNVLRQVAAALKQSGREYDVIARYGGEEFAAVLPGCSSALALQVAERLRRAIEEAATDVPVTASAGVATYPSDGADVHTLLEAADRALYAAKGAGRNQVRAAVPLRAVDDAAPVDRVVESPSAERSELSRSRR